MKKKLFTGLMVVFAVMAMANFALAGPGCGSSSKDSKAGCAKTCAAPCPSMTTAKADTDGKMINAKVDCDYKGKCETISMNISGMTCTGCESSITTSLMKQDGVIKVVSIDHQTGHATVCFDPTKVESEDLAKLVTKTGYKANVMAALATDEATVAHTKACQAMTKTDKKMETEKENY